MTYQFIPSSGRRRVYFLAVLARSHGFAASFILNYARSVCRLPKQRGATLFVESLAERFPFLGRDQVYRALRRLQINHNGMPPLIQPDPQGKRQHRFSLTVAGLQVHPRIVPVDRDVAIDYGIVCGVIFASLESRVLEAWALAAFNASQLLSLRDYDGDQGRLLQDAVRLARGSAVYEIRVSRWKQYRGFLAIRTVQRCFSKLVSGGLVVRSPEGDFWSLSDSHPGPSIVEGAVDRTTVSPAESLQESFDS